VFELGANGRGLCFWIDTRPSVRVGEMHSDRLNQRRRIFAVARQCPIGLVQPAVSVFVEEPLELAKKSRAGKRRAHRREAAVRLRQPLHPTRLGSRHIGECDEIERLLPADGSLSGREM
jgi:hypothetical protein